MVCEDALKEYAEIEGVEIEWVAESYEYNFSRATQKMCNKGIAEILYRMIWCRELVDMVESC